MMSEVGVAFDPGIEYLKYTPNPAAKPRAPSSSKQKSEDAIRSLIDNIVAAPTKEPNPKRRCPRVTSNSS